MEEKLRAPPLMPPRRPLFVYGDGSPFADAVRETLASVELPGPAQFATDLDELRAAFDESDSQVLGEGVLPLQMVLLVHERPDDNTRAWVSRLKAEADWRMIPVVLLTAEAEPEAAGSWYAIGVSGWVSLPSADAERRAVLESVARFWTLSETP